MGEIGLSVAKTINSWGWESPDNTNMFYDLAYELTMEDIDNEKVLDILERAYEAMIDDCGLKAAK